VIKMPVLKFVSLKCHRTDDSTEKDQSYDLSVEDEPYLRANHKQVWGVTRMKINEIKDLSDVEPITFNDDILVELWDKDAGYSPEDDRLGKVTIVAGLAGTGSHEYEFRRRKARYTLTYKVE
jgi:hypothetical protein